MKIVIVAGGHHLFGKEVIALELGKGLHDSGHQVSFVSSLWCGDGEFGSRLRRLGIPARFMRLGFISATLSLDCIRMTLDQLIRVPGLWLDYARFLRQERPDHVIHTNWQHLLVLRPFPNANRDWLWLHEVVPDKPQYRLVFQLLARRLRGFIAVSHAVKDALLGIGISAYQVRVIHNGLEDPYGVEHERVEPWDGARIGIVGQVAPWKGHQDLLEAFGMLAIKHSNVDLHVYGDDSSAFAQMLKRRSEELRISNRIVWHGFVPGRNDIYRKMDICIVPSAGADPLPTTAIEAGFFGLPVVASRVGGMSEIVDEGETGFLVDAGNTKQLAARINELLENPNLRKKMGWRARQRVQQRFSRDRFVAQFSQSMAEGTCLG